MTAALIVAYLLIFALMASLSRQQMRLAELRGDYQCLRRVVVNVADRTNDAIKQANALRSDLDSTRDKFAAPPTPDPEAIDRAVREGVIDVLRPVSQALTAALESKEDGTTHA